MKLRCFSPIFIPKRQKTSSINCLRRVDIQAVMANYVDIDGSILEGGGQILRMSIGFSAILGIPVRVSNIRANRSKPGLAAQHMKGIHLVAEMCKAKVNGAHIGSTSIEFHPHNLGGGNYVADTQTAGSISLLLQVALPCALLADSPVQLTLRGGTNADMAPQVDYITEVFRPNLEKFGTTFDFDLHRRGYYPKGGGHVTVNISPSRSFNSVTLKDRGTIDKIYGWSFVAGTLPMSLSYQMSDSAKKVLGGVCRSNVDIECYKESQEMAPHNCSGIVLVAESSTGCVLGGSALGKRGVQAAEVGRAAAEELKTAIESGACVDSYTQDQIIIFMALADGKSSVKVGEVSLHTKTAIYIAEILAKCKFEIIPDGQNNIIECTGIGFINKYLKNR